MTNEEFERWRDDAVTRWVFRAIAVVAEENKDKWVEASWVYGNPRPELLAELRTRADAYRALIDTNYEGWCETNGEEPFYAK